MTTNPEIDPTIFAKDQELEFSFALTSCAEEYVRSLDAIARWERENSAESKKALESEVQKLPEFQRIIDMVGEDFGVMVTNVAVEAAGSTAIDQETHEADIASRDDSIALLGEYIFGYQDYMHTNLMDVFEGDETEAVPASWSAAWNKLRSVLHPVGGTALAEVVEYFDGLIQLRYADFYEPSDRLRGPVVAGDVSARTFYEVMEPHLGRAILKRRQGDEWS